MPVSSRFLVLPGLNSVFVINARNDYRLKAIMLSFLFFFILGVCVLFSSQRLDYNKPFNFQYIASDNVVKIRVAAL